MVVATVTNPGLFMATITHPLGTVIARIGYCVACEQNGYHYGGE